MEFHLFWAETGTTGMGGSFRRHSGPSESMRALVILEGKDEELHEVSRQVKLFLFHPKGWRLLHKAGHTPHYLYFPHALTDEWEPTPHQFLLRPDTTGYFPLAWLPNMNVKVPC